MDCELISKIDEDNDIIVKNSDKQILIDFDYLEPNKGFIIKIVHTGISTNCLGVLGKIIGGSNIMHSFPYQERVNTIFLSAISKFIFFIFKIIFIPLGLFYIIASFISNSISILEKILVIIFGVIMIIGGIMLIRIKKTPKILEKILKED